MGDGGAAALEVLGCNTYVINRPEGTEVESFQANSTVTRTVLA